jgi:hypothetical protein
VHHADAGLHRQEAGDIGTGEEADGHGWLGWRGRQGRAPLQVAPAPS